MGHLSRHTSPGRLCRGAFQFGGTFFQFHDELVVLFHQGPDFVIVVPFDRLVFLVDFDVAEFVLNQGQGLCQSFGKVQDENERYAEQYQYDVDIGKHKVLDFFMQVRGAREVGRVEVG